MLEEQFPQPDLSQGFVGCDSEPIQLAAESPDYRLWLPRWEIHLLKSPCHIVIPHEASHLTIPLIPLVWRHLLADYPNASLAQFFLAGITQGFRIGFVPGSMQLESAKSNMHSALEHAEVVTEYIMKEGRIAGSFPHSLIPGAHTSRFGVIPKSHQPGKWRLIIDLSHPKQHSVNDGIPKELRSISYISTDDAIGQILTIGKNCLLAKIDIKSAFRLIPVHPADRHLLAMNWENQIFIDKCLPFGLRSAPKLFNLLADLLEWVAKDQGVTYLMHYLDDYLTAGHPGSEECQRNLMNICQILGIPLAEDKVMGPTTSIEFLGIQLDTSRMEARLPAEKLTRLYGEIIEWRHKRKAKKRDILSLVGQLQHAAKVVRPGRTFVRRMYSTACLVKELDYFVRLNQEFRSDVYWWYTFLQSWNGISFFANTTVEGVVQTDVSGNWGCGAVYAQKWFQWSWDSGWKPKNIMVKELVPVIIACAVWGPLLSRRSIKFQCDNTGVVAAVTKGTSKEPLAMHLLRCLWFFTAHYDIALHLEHLPGTQNQAADHLSRNNLPAFRLTSPQACRLPTLLPHELIELVITDKPDWTSPHFNQLFSAILTKV